MDYKEELVCIGRRIEELRKSYGWTIQDLAYRCEMEHSDVSEIEDGKIDITFRTLCRIAHGLGIQLKEILM